jgi:16S rRNA (uracil1498-N3)-methyltransferase
MHLFYNADIEIKSPEPGWNLFLEGDEAKHCINVLRLKKGDIIHITNGKGYILECEIEATTKKTCSLVVSKIEKRKQKDFHLHLVVAPTKNISRFEWFLEKATEIGINEITPVICDNSVRDKFKTDRSERIIIAAVKQSLKAWKPIINNAIELKDFLERDFLAQKFIAHYENENQAKLIESAEKSRDTIIIIGPEGDFSEDELKLAKQRNYKSVSLSESRLRTETAALTATLTINLINQ